MSSENSASRVSVELSVWEVGIVSTNFTCPVFEVGETFYLCNSSFEYFPGLPIHTSKELQIDFCCVSWCWSCTMRPSSDAGNDMQNK